MLVTVQAKRAELGVRSSGDDESSCCQCSEGGVQRLHSFRVGGDELQTIFQV